MGAKKSTCGSCFLGGFFLYQPAALVDAKFLPIFISVSAFQSCISRGFT